ncbi:hypothetical protein [Hufsiella ginkgonis]|uniref:Uncharacterized protein n=1 Tax=Hufsiella ginkgonis TaxID=2695274 RepID=A0A7K1XZJ4_9SPHI|nr:hypothetical protein [Hufsiella ginkgonis]MXV15966.1 hypothetical protein [Hufsiella ginkgonis]
MSAITLSPSGLSVAQDRPAAAAAKVPLYIYATVFSSLSIIIGLIWDISWHMSIGRDGLFSPPHLAIYLGAVVAGTFSGYHVLRVTFAGSAAERSQSVKFWGMFYGSLGALFAIWGAFTMITSAPFDDWWHNTFGLDVQILSPPHTVLLLGMVTVQFGAIVSVLALGNRLDAGASNATRTVLRWSFALSSGFMLIMLFTIASEYLTRHDMHSTVFYQVSGGLFPLFMVAVSVSSFSRWGATAMAAVYTVIMALMVWVLPLFHAEPLLGPVLNRVESFQSFHFPLLLIVPAFGIDLALQRLGGKNIFIRALATGVIFTALLFAAQWPFGNLLMSGSPNRFLGTDSWYFGSSPDYAYRYLFYPGNVASGVYLVKGMAIALVAAIISSFVGLSWGSWMKSVKR